MPEKNSEKKSWTPTPWAFISSVKVDFEEYRNAAIEACLKARILPIAMESWTASSKPSIDLCYKYIEECDVIILIVGYRYGTLFAKNGKSYTEFEWEKANKLNKPIFTFVASSLDKISVQKMSPGDIESTHAFLNKISSSHWGEFNNSQQLLALIYQALTEWRQEAELQKSESDLSEGDMLVLFLSAPDTAERTMKKMLYKLKNTTSKDRDTAAESIIREFEREIERLESKSLIEEEKVAKLVAKTAAGIMEREFTNFLHELELKPDKSPFEIYKDVLNNMIEFERTRWSSSDAD